MKTPIVRNKIYITGADDDINRFKRMYGIPKELSFDSTSFDFRFNNIFPTDKYDRLAHIENWGCPEELVGESLFINSYGVIYHKKNVKCDTLEIKFKCIENPPFGIYNKLKEQFPSLYISWMYYFEDEMVCDDMGNPILEDFQPNRYFMH